MQESVGRSSMQLVVQEYRIGVAVCNDDRPPARDMQVHLVSRRGVHVESTGKEHREPVTVLRKVQAEPTGEWRMFDILSHERAQALYGPVERRTGMKQFMARSITVDQQEPGPGRAQGRADGIGMGFHRYQGFPHPGFRLDPGSPVEFGPWIRWPGTRFDLRPGQAGIPRIRTARIISQQGETGRNRQNGTGNRPHGPE